MQNCIFLKLLLASITSIFLKHLSHYSNTEQFLTNTLPVLISNPEVSYPRKDFSRDQIKKAPACREVNEITHYCIAEQFNAARRAGPDGSMFASGSAGPGFDPRRGSKF